MRRSAFDAGVCVDLGTFDPEAKDGGAKAWLDRAMRVPSWVVLMEDRAPDFFHGYRGYQAQEAVPLNRHGPRTDRWTQADVKRLVAGLHDEGVDVLLGYWAHEGRFTALEHPELLIRDADGALWRGHGDFNPMRRLRADPERGIEEGDAYSAWSGKQYARLAADFGFDGLFLGDGAMGFRRHGIDWKDLRHFDFHEDWLAEFRADVGFAPHAGCALDEPKAPTRERADDVLAHHWPHWVAWNVARWTGYYREMATSVHATGGSLAAYNCMNYDPTLARLHGVDYRGIAEAGLDMLVFQAYDYAWGPLGPFGDLHIARKDLTTNLACLLRLRAQIGHDTRMRMVVTVETEDEVELWDTPVPHTLGELYDYGAAQVYDGNAWRRAVDGAFVVWGNSVPTEEWRTLGSAISHIERARPEPPEAAGVWRPSEPVDLVDGRAPVAVDADDIYRHLAVSETVGTGNPHAALVRHEHAGVAPLSSRAPAMRLRAR